MKSNKCSLTKSVCPLENSSRYNLLSNHVVFLKNVILPTPRLVKFQIKTKNANKEKFAKTR